MKNYLDSIDRDALRSRAEQMLHTAGNACDQAGRFMNTTTEKIRGFSLIEFFIYETCTCCRSVCGWAPASLNSSKVPRDHLRSVCRNVAVPAMARVL